MRFTLIFILSIAFASAVLLPVTEVKAQEQELDRNQLYRERIDQSASLLNSLRAEIEAGNADPTKVESYLYHSLMLVYTGKLLANVDFGPAVLDTNGDLALLASRGLIPFWPGNPLAKFEPMQVLTPADGFSAGDLCLSLCPPEYYSDIPAGLAPVSFDIFVYGPDQLLDQFGEIYQYGRNSDWSAIPDGALYGLSYYMQSRLDVEEAYREYRERIERERPSDS